MLAKRIALLLVLPGLVLISGCASYKAVTLPHLQPEFAPYSEAVEGVVLSAKTFSHADCKRYFDRDIISAGYIPVHLTIQNNSKGYILFSPQGINVPTAPADEVAEKVHTSTAGRATAYGVGALFIWPLIIPAVIDGVGSSKANEQLDRDFDAKTAGQVVVQPYSVHNGVIFIPAGEFQQAFDVSLVERETKERLLYHVRDLPAAPPPKEAKTQQDIASDESPFNYR